MVRAIASIVIGRPDQGLEGSREPRDRNGYDLQLWKALAFARQGKWPDAREKFKNVEFAIATLPVDLQRIVISDAMRARSRSATFAGAARRSSDLDVIGIPPEMKPADGGAERPARRSARPRQGRADGIQVLR